MIYSLVCFIAGALTYKLLNSLIMAREIRAIYDKASLHLLGLAYRVKKSLDIFNEIRRRHIEKLNLAGFEKEANSRFNAHFSEMEMEMLIKIIHSSFPETYKKVALYTNWSEVKEIIEKMEKNNLL